MTAWGFNPRNGTACGSEALKERVMEFGVMYARDVRPS